MQYQQSTRSLQVDLEWRAKPWKNNWFRSSRLNQEGIYQRLWEENNPSWNQEASLDHQKWNNSNGWTTKIIDCSHLIRSQISHN